MTSNAGSVLAISALVAAPVAAFIPLFLFPGLAGQKTGIRRIVACYLIVSLFTAGFACYFFIGSLSMVPRMYSLMPASNGAVFLVGVAVDLVLPAGIYRGREKTGVLMEG